MDLFLLTNGKYTGKVCFRDIDDGSWFLSHTLNMMKTFENPSVFIIEPIKQNYLYNNVYNTERNLYYIRLDGIRPMWLHIEEINSNKGLLRTTDRLDKGFATHAFSFEIQNNHVIIKSAMYGYLGLDNNGILVCCGKNKENASKFKIILL